jgi:hypothetical protein
MGIFLRRNILRVVGQARFRRRRGLLMEFVDGKIRGGFSLMFVGLRGSELS